MREPDRDGVLEAALPRARHRQGRPPRGLRYPGRSTPLPSLSLSVRPLLPTRAGCGSPGDAHFRGKLLGVSAAGGVICAVRGHSVGFA